MVRQKRLQNTIYIQNIWMDTVSGIGGSPTGHNLVVSSINSFYLTDPTRSSNTPDLDK